MNNKQIAKQNMHQAVLLALEENAGIYASVPAFQNAADEFKALVSEIDETARLQLKSTVEAATAEKADTEITLVNETVKVANALYAMAMVTNNEALLPKARMTKSMLYSSSDRNALILARNIFSLAGDHTEELADYGIDAEAIAQLEQATNAYEQQIAGPRAAISGRKSITSQLAALFARADTLLNDRIDKMMSLFKTSQPDFYAVYFNARNIINTAARKQKTGTEEVPADDNRG